MLDDEVEEIGHSMTANEKLHLFGMRRDDEEDLLADVEALLGCFAVYTIKCADSPPKPGPAPKIKARCVQWDGHGQDFFGPK
jgi:hypothetical protein